MSDMSAERLLFRIAAAALLLCSLAMGGMDQSGDINASNMTRQEFSIIVPSASLQDSFIETDAPDAVSAFAGQDVAFYTEQAPIWSELQRLTPSFILTSPPGYMYYNGDYMSWINFTATFPAYKPGLWIERAVSWSYYATMPWGTWTKMLIYVPQASPVTIYEIYPSGYVLGYSLGYVQHPGYYYTWYYADSPGRHSSLAATASGYSNAVIIDVYGTVQHIKPTPHPTPKEECEKKSYCTWSNNQCLCYMPPESAKDRCEKTAGCHWVNNNCDCVMPVDPEKEQCESNPTCDWVNGHCYCRGLDNSEKTECEKSTNCRWVNNQCDCTMPEPEPSPEPTPDPEPFNPAPNPTAKCGSGCYWANGQCNCMGLGEAGEVSDYSDNFAA